jgi:Ni/Co efflux regulator RcnB
LLTAARRLNRLRQATVAEEVQVNRVRTAVVAALLAAFVGAPPALAQPNGRARGHYKKEERREREEAREAYWDAAKHYRHDERRYRPRHLGRNDRIYRGSDNRYYCKRDDGTTGLIVGGITGGVLGNVIAPGGSKTIGTIAGAGLGAIIGKAIDDGDIVCH